jgi:hypothetical protein
MPKSKPSKIPIARGLCSTAANAYHSRLWVLKGADDGKESGVDAASAQRTVTGLEMLGFFFGGSFYG